MARVAVKNPRRIGEKLHQIRLMLELSQNGIIARMGLERELKRTSVSNFERKRRVPSLLVLLRYARVAGICLEVLVDDELELPKELSSLGLHDYRAKTSETLAKK
jgi:transcriptional regulator with XRE-family HTH domain